MEVAGLVLGVALHRRSLCPMFPPPPLGGPALEALRGCGSGDTQHAVLTQEQQLLGQL